MYVGYIYRHYILINNIEVSYIGLTTQDIENRWLDGWGYLNGQKTVFGEAIVKYGWDNFQHEIIVEVSCQTKEELDEVLDSLEKKYIELYDSFHNGFNSTTGGKKDFVMKKKNDVDVRKIICLTTGEVFNSIYAAAKTYNIDKRSIARNIAHKQSYAGRHPITKECMIWAYENQQDQDTPCKTYKYICYNDQEKYVTYREMSEVYGFPIGQIRKCCTGEKECLYTCDGEPMYFGML